MLQKLYIVNVLYSGRTKEETARIDAEILRRYMMKYTTSIETKYLDRELQIQIPGNRIQALNVEKEVLKIIKKGHGVSAS